MTGSMIIPKDEAVRESIRNNLETSLVIEAGAGTGKTTLLIDRLMSLLHKFDISEIVAITFTEKAAAELSERLRTRLELSVNDVGESHPLLKALNNFDRARISTIHSFAASIIRERPIEVEIDPEFSLVEPDVEKDLLKTILTDDLNKSNIDRDSAIMRFLQLGGTFEHIQTMLGNLYEHRDLIDFIPVDSESFDEIAISGHLSNWLLEQNKQVELHCSNSDDRLLLKLNEIIQGYPKDENGIWSWLGNWKPFKTSRLGTKKNWDSAEALNNCREELTQFADDVGNLVYQARTETLEQLVKWLDNLIKRAETVKRDNGQLGYQDLLLLTRKLLDRPDILQHFQDKFKRILIDEFQDTDPLQVEIAMMLAQKSSDKNQKSPDNGMLEPGKLCIVGDPKQSIYRFRRADPRVYQSATDDILKTGNKLFITQNFRSAAGIVNFVNRFFTSMWMQISNDESNYVPIDPLENRIDLFPIPSVSILTPPSQQYDDTAKTDYVRLVEAQAIAMTISTAVDRWLVAERQPDNTLSSRPARYGDIAILFPSTTDLDLFSDVLTESGIPFQVEGGKKFYRAQIITDLFNCIAAVDNPADRLVVMGALRSPFLGISDEVLVHWIDNSNGLLDYRQDNFSKSPALSDALKILKDLHNQRNDLSPDRLIDKLLYDTDSLPAIASQPYGDSDVMLLRKIIDLAKIYAPNGGGSLRSFRRWLANRMSYNDEKRRGSPDNSNRVKLMTVHAAKGLEFPILFLANMNSEFKNNPDIIYDRLHKRFEFGIGSRSKDVRFESSGFSELLAEEQEIQSAERLRLLYVAMTRACDHLILPMFYGKRLAGYTKWINEFIQAEEESTDLYRILEAEPYAPPVEVQVEVAKLTIDSDRIWDEKEKWTNDRSERLVTVKKQLPKILRPSSHLLQVEPGRFERTGEDLSLAGSIGRAVHRYMSLCLMEATVDNSLIDHFANEESISVDDISLLIMNCLKSNVWSYASKARRIWREVPISLKSSDGLVRGSVDLIWEDDDGELYIADWKTGAHDPQKHQTQIKQYASVINSSTGCNVRFGYLHFAKRNLTVEVSLE